jgi:hypothetical protein
LIYLFLEFLESLGPAGSETDARSGRGERPARGSPDA